MVSFLVLALLFLQTSSIRPPTMIMPLKPRKALQATMSTTVVVTDYTPIITGFLGGEKRCADWGLKGDWGGRKRKLYYAFILNDELDILEIVLHEIFEAVDVIIIVEGALSFTGYYKGLHYKQNEKAFAKYASKIRHVQVDFVREMPAMLQALGHRFGWDEWEYEEWTRHATLRGADDIGADDIFLLADVDELTSRAYLHALAHCDLDMEPAPKCEVRGVVTMGFQYHFGCHRIWPHKVSA
jgi:hypothetical protein